MGVISLIVVSLASTAYLSNVQFIKIKVSQS